MKINHDRFINFIFPSLQLKLKQLMNQYSKNELTKFILKYSNNNNVPKFYIIPKVHKPVLSSRPITASHKWIFTPASALLAEMLNPIVENNNTYLKIPIILLIFLLNFLPITYLI